MCQPTLLLYLTIEIIINTLDQSISIVVLIHGGSHLSRIVGDDGIYHYVNDNFVNVYTMPKTEALIKDARYLNRENTDNKELSKNIFDEFDSIIEEDSKSKKSTNDTK